MRVETNILNLEVGDVIIFSNSKNYHKKMVIRRIEDRSCYLSNIVEGETQNFVFRESWNTIANRRKYPNFEIIKAK